LRRREEEKRFKGERRLSIGERRRRKLIGSRRELNEREENSYEREEERELIGERRESIGRE
jgi:hypothetical protein